VDDLADRAFFPAQIVVNPTVTAQLHYDGPRDCRPAWRRYVMLREGFWPWTATPRAGRPARTQLLVTMGGGEASQALLEVLDILPLAGVDDLRHVVAGSLRTREELLRSAEAQPNACRCPSRWRTWPPCFLGARNGFPQRADRSGRWPTPECRPL
jgi:spore coat polysaccharide biosynthesis predicted glycosyltransferase SpsG